MPPGPSLAWKAAVTSSLTRLPTIPVRSCCWKFGTRGGVRSRPLDAVPFVVRALHALMSEALFEIPRHLLMLSVIVAVADRLHLVEVDARPDDVKVLAAKLFMQHHDAGVAC